MIADNPSEVWRTPPELEQPLPRPVRLSGSGIFSCMFAVVFVAAGLWIAYRPVHDELRRDAQNASLARSLAADGRKAEATVTRLFTGLGYVVSYQFTVDGRSYEKNAFISSQHWHSLQAGSPLTIRYLPADPKQSFPESDSPNSQTHWSVTLLVAGMALFFMFSFAAIQLSAVLPKRRLLASGRPARGAVTSCKEGYKGRSSGYFWHYEFPLGDGNQCQGKAFRGEPTAEGSTVTVLYDQDRPSRNALYPMEMVRLAAG
jgi:hypothetical protein